jgi:hypothetical protein
VKEQAARKANRETSAIAKKKKNGNTILALTVSLSTTPFWDGGLILI